MKLRSTGFGRPHQDIFGLERKPSREPVLDFLQRISYAAYEQRTLMAAIFLLCLVLSFLAYLLATRVYESDIHFVVNESPYIAAVNPQAGMASGSQLLVQSILAGIESENMRSVLASRLHIPRENLRFGSAAGMKPNDDKPRTARIAVRPARDSRVMAISVYSHDPQFALLAAQEITTELLSLNTIVGRITSLQADLSVVQGKINRLADALAQSAVDRFRPASPLAGSGGRDQSLESSLKQQRYNADLIKDQINKLILAVGDYQMRSDLRLFDRSDLPGEKAGVIVVTDPPLLAANPVMPRLPLYCFFGLLLSVVISVAAGILNYEFDRTVRNPKQLEMSCGHICVALLPESDTSSLGQPFGPVPEPESVAGLSYLRSQMLRAALGGGANKVFVFCGLGRHAESAELVTKLAVLLAKAEKRTLLIDFDFKNPQVATLMGIKSQKGLSEWMFSENRIQDYIEYSVVRELAVIQPGRISGYVDDLISRKPLAPVIDQLQAEWDFILINAPNLLEESHLLLAAPASAPVIVVARYADARLDDLDALAARCEECNFTFVGVVLHHYPRSRLNSGTVSYELGTHQYVLESAAT